MIRVFLSAIPTLFVGAAAFGHPGHGVSDYHDHDVGGLIMLSATLVIGAIGLISRLVRVSGRRR